MLVLKDVKSQEDYFLQQAHFVSKEGRHDEYAEFSTNINVVKETSSKSSLLKKKEKKAYTSIADDDDVDDENSGDGKASSLS
eukprot:15325898-Ditylum_brightwellii.AAC.1